MSDIMELLGHPYAIFLLFISAVVMMVIGVSAISLYEHAQRAAYCEKVIPAVCAPASMSAACLELLKKCE